MATFGQMAKCTVKDKAGGIGKLVQIYILLNGLSKCNSLFLLNRELGVGMSVVFLFHRI